MTPQGSGQVVYRCWCDNDRSVCSKQPGHRVRYHMFATRPPFLVPHVCAPIFRLFQPHFLFMSSSRFPGGVLPANIVKTLKRLFELVSSFETMGSRQERGGYTDNGLGCAPCLLPCHAPATLLACSPATLLRPMRRDPILGGLYNTIFIYLGVLSGNLPCPPRKPHVVGEKSRHDCVGNLPIQQPSLSTVEPTQQPSLSTFRLQWSPQKLGPECALILKRC